MNVSSIRSWAPAHSPANTLLRISGRLLRPWGLAGSYGPPAHTVSSLSWSRSVSVPPNTMAPSRPLPMGSASSHAAAGRGYQRVSSPGRVALAPVPDAAEPDLPAAWAPPAGTPDAIPAAPAAVAVDRAKKCLRSMAPRLDSSNGW